MLHYQHYQPELAQSQQQQQGLVLGVHQYQQHPDGLMHFQHQPGLGAVQQGMHGVGGLMGSGMGGHQLQDRSQYYGRSEHDAAAASQPVMPSNYAQVGQCMPCQPMHATP